MRNRETEYSLSMRSTGSRLKQPRDLNPSLDEMDASIDKTESEKKRVFPVAGQVDKFVRSRNNAFHFGDPTEDMDWLIQLSNEIENADINLLNLVLREFAFVSLGECLKTDALAKCQ